MTKWVLCASGKAKKSAGSLLAVNSACCVTIDPWQEKAACAINARIYLMGIVDGYGVLDLIASTASLAAMKAAAKKLYVKIGENAATATLQRFVKPSGVVSGSLGVVDDYTAEIDAAVDFQALQLVVSGFNTAIQASMSFGGTERFGQTSPTDLSSSNAKSRADAAWSASSTYATSAAGRGVSKSVTRIYNYLGIASYYAEHKTTDYDSVWAHWTDVTASIDIRLHDPFVASAWILDRAVAAADIASVGGEPPGHTWGYVGGLPHTVTDVAWAPGDVGYSGKFLGSPYLWHTFSIPDTTCVLEKLRSSESEI